MENLTPPNIATAEEIQAWQNMMETMVTFIKASTHLMNTINQKVGLTAAPPAVAREVSFQQPPQRQPYAQQQYPQPPQQPYYSGCEPECVACTPKPPCGVCTDDGTKTLIPAGKKTSTSKTADIPSVTLTPPTPERIEEAAPVEEAPAEAEAPPAPEEANNEDNPEAEGEEATGGENAEPAAQEPAVAPEKDKLEVPGSKPTSRTKVPSGSTGELVNDGTKCVCAAIRAQRLAAAGQPGDAERQKTEIVRGKENVEDLCGCTPTEEESAQMVEEIQNSLVEAREEISRMEGQVEELRKIVKPTRKEKESKALYNEIMKTGDSRKVRSQGDPSSRLPLSTFGTGITPIYPLGTGRAQPMAVGPPRNQRVQPMTFGASISPIYPPGVKGPAPPGGLQSADYRSLGVPSAYPTTNPPASQNIPYASAPGYQSQDYRSLRGPSAYPTRSPYENSQMATCGSACPGLSGLESDYEEDNYYDEYQQAPVTTIQRICTNRPINNTTSGTAVRSNTRAQPSPAYENYPQPQRYAPRQPAGASYGGSNPNCNPTASCNQPTSRYR